MCACGDSLQLDNGFKNSRFIGLVRPEHVLYEHYIYINNDDLNECFRQYAEQQSAKERCHGVHKSKVLATLPSDLHL